MLQSTPPAPLRTGATVSGLSTDDLTMQPGANFQVALNASGPSSEEFVTGAVNLVDGDTDPNLVIDVSGNLQIGALFTIIRPPTPKAGCSPAEQASPPPIIPATSSR